LEQAIQAFLAELKYVQARSSNTLAAYKTDLAQFKEAVARHTGHTPTMLDVTVESVDAYVTWLDLNRYRASTVARKMAAVRAFLRYAYGTGEHGPESLLARLKPPPSPIGRRTRVLTRDEVGRLLAVPVEKGRARDLRDRAILSLLYVTGIRVAEAVRLRTGDIDLGFGVLRGAGDRPEKALGRAHEPIRAYLKEARPQLAKDLEQQTLFLNQRGGGLSRQGLWLVVKRWARNAGLKGPISPHTLRRSRAEHMLEDGQRKGDVQRFLGLSSPNTLRLRPVTALDGEEEPRDER
jgi:integrase/recombinase XerD